MKLDKKIIYFLFYLLSILLFCNVNGILNNLFQIHAATSPLILLIALFLFAFIPKKKSYFTYPIVLFIATMLSLYSIGLISGFIFIGETNFELGFAFDAIRKIFTSLFIFLVFALFIISEPASKNKSHFKFITTLFLITTLFGVLESVFGLRPVSLDVGYDTERTLGFFGNPNLTGLQSNYTLSIVLGLFLTRSIGLKFTAVSIPIIIYASVSSFSKTAILTSGILMVIFMFLNIKNCLFFYKNKTAKNSAILLTSYMLFILLIIVPAANSYYENLGLGQQRRLNNVFTLVTKGEISRKTTSSRSAIYSDGITMIKKNPIIGYGVLTFSHGGMFKSSIKHGIHNTYLRLIGEAGFIPLVLFLLFGLVSTLYVIKNPSYLSFASIFILMAFFIHAFTDHTALHDKFSIALLGCIIGYTTNSNTE